MKRCPQCKAENADSMNFCLQCGTPLPQIVVNLQNDSQSGGGPPTNPNAPRGTNTFVENNRANFAPNYAPPQSRPRSSNSSNTKLFLILGGVFSLFLLLVFAGVAIIGYNIMSSKNTIANITPTPIPTRTITTIKTPTPTYSTSPNVSPSVNSATAPGGKFDRMWVDYNVKEGDRTGMRIHVKFSAYNLKGADCYLAVYFQDADGKKLTSNNNQFRSKQGNLAVFRLLRPGFDNTTYEDLELFMPYGELNMPVGKHNLKMDADLISKEGELIQHLNLYDFQYEQFAVK